MRLQKDERLVELIREGHDRAFEALWDRYQARLFAFCRHMLPSDQDAEDVLQDVFVSAHKAMLGDERHLNVRPWLYRIARNRCLNHLRRKTADGQDTMDDFVHGVGTSTAEHVHNREELRALLRDVRHLPETQRTALLLREVDAMAYTEIAQAMGTTVPAVKSLLVRARVSLAEASQARLLTCSEVRVQLAEAAEGLRKVGGSVRYHVRHCPDCHGFRDELQASTKALAALLPIGPLAAFKGFLAAKLGFGGSGSSAAGGAGAGSSAAAGGATSGGAAVASGGGIGTAIGGLALGGGAGGLGGAVSGVLGAKAAAGLATAAVLTAGAVEVNRYVSAEPVEPGAVALAAETPAIPADAIREESRVVLAAVAGRAAVIEPPADASARAEPAGQPAEPVSEPAEPVAATEPAPEPATEPAPEESTAEPAPAADSSTSELAPAEGDSPFVTGTEPPAGGVPPEGPPPGTTTGPAPAGGTGSSTAPPPVSDDGASEEPSTAPTAGTADEGSASDYPPSLGD